MKNRIIEKLHTNGNGTRTQGAQPAASPTVDWNTMKDGLSTVTSFVAEHPAQCLGAAFATGILLGWIVKRS